MARLSFDVWEIEEGLEQNPITSVVQSRDGYLWLGTYAGLMRYDGVRVTLFDSSTTPVLQTSRVTSLYEDPDGVLWIGHETGELTRLEAGQFTPVLLGPGWPGGPVEAISMDENRDLWLLTDLGALFRLRDGHAIEAPGGPSPSRKVTLCREEGGKLWVAANGQVATLAGSQLARFRFDSTNEADFFERVAPARDGGLWVTANGRMREWRQGRWVADLGDCPCTQGFVTELMETRSGMLLAGTVKDGLYVLRPGAEPLHLTHTNGLSHDWVRSLCEDHEGNIWIGTGGGLDALRPRKVTMLNPPDAWQGRAVQSFAVSGKGDAWVGTEGAGLYHYQNGQWSHFTETNGLANLFVWSVLETRRGELFVGTWGGGLMVKNGDRFESPGELARVTAPIVALYESSKGEVWIGTTIGLYRYEAGKLTAIAGKEKLFLPDVRAIAETPDGALWFGMVGGGLGRFKDGALNQFRKQDGLPSDFVLALCAAADGTLWLGTSDHGLCRLQRGKFKSIGVQQGLPANNISQIAEDGAGNLWMGSSRGILRARITDLQRCAAGELDTVPCLNYDKADGLASQKCSGGFQPAIGQSADGRLWFPTGKGLAVIDPANVITNAVPPPVVIEELWVEGRPWDLTPLHHRGPAVKSDSALRTPRATPLRIPPGNKQFEIRYTGLSFAAPDKVRFRHKLDGLEQDWSEPKNARVATYSYLRPGAYTFHVKACNNDGVWNEAEASLAFNTLPYFWQTSWFKYSSLIAGAVAVAAGGMGVTRRRVQRKLEQLERQRALERERTRIARDIHDDLGASLTRISLLSQSVRGELDDHEAAAADADRIFYTARELTRAMDEIVWAVNPRHDTFDSLVAYLGRFAQNFLSAAGIRCRLDEPPHLPSWTLTSEIRHNVFLAFKEGLHNVVKHAGASEVRVAFELQAAGFVLVIADNGRGFDWNEIKARTAGPPEGARLATGNGVLNMQRRMEEVGGRCEWVTAPAEGTRVKLTVSVKP